MIIVTIIKKRGDHTHQNVREERNRYLSFYHNYRSLMSVSKKTRSHYRKTKKINVELHFSFSVCKKIRINNIIQIQSI